MKLYDGSLAKAILEYLYAAPEVARKRLYVPFASYEYTTYSKTVKRLLTEGCIELFRKDDLNYVRITGLGKKELEKKDKSRTKELRAEKPNTSTKQRANRARRVANVVALCTANGYLVDKNEKPELEKLLAAPGTDGNLRREFEAALYQGTFYSISEIQAAIKGTYNRNDSLKLTRLVGIVLCGRNMTFVYSIGTGIIKWNATNEFRAVDAIQKYFQLSPLLTSVVAPQRKSSCVICGENYSAVPKIVAGSTWGTWHDDARTSPKEYYRRKSEGEWLTSKNLAKVFHRAYFVCAGVQDIPYFRSAMMLNEETIHSVEAEWWKDNIDSATHLSNLPYFQGITTENGRHESVALSIFVDVIELLYYHNRNKPTHMVISQKGAKDAISKVMGPNLLSLRLTTGEVLSVNRYDEDGLLIQSAKGNLKPIRTIHKEKA